MCEKFFCAITIAFCTIGCKQYDKSIPISIPLFSTANGSKVDFTSGLKGLHWKTTDILVSKTLQRKVLFCNSYLAKKNTDTSGMDLSRAEAAWEVEKLVLEID